MNIVTLIYIGLFCFLWARALHRAILIEKASSLEHYTLGNDLAALAESENAYLPRSFIIDRNAANHDKVKNSRPTP